MANEIYSVKGTSYTWKASGGSALLTLTSLAAGGIRAGAAIDRGAGAKPFIGQLEAHLNYASALTLAQTLASIWILESEDNVVWPGNLTSGDAGVAAGKLNNLGMAALTLTADSTTNGEWQRSRTQGDLILRARYLMPVVVNWHGSIAMDGTDLGYLELFQHYEQLQA